MNRLRLGMLSLVGFVWLGCSAAGSNNNGGTGGNPGTGGGVGTGGGFGSGGVSSGSGGVSSGSGGVVSGSGGVVSGSGGVVSGSGGVVSGSGGTAGGVECTGAATTNGRMDNGTMCGYAWTATNGEGETIDPPCGNGACFMGATVCATAEIPANTIVAPVAYTGVMIGWNVAQEGDTPSTWTSTGTGITVNYTVTGATGVERVLIQSGSKDYCAVATPGVAMQWADFSVECWDGGGEVFTVGSPVTAIAVQINGDDAAAQSVELCLTSVVNN